MDLLNAESAKELVINHGLAETNEPVTVTQLAGGVSNIVLKVETPRRALVLKQALPRLLVEEEWLADVSRLWREVECLRLLAEMLPAGAVPKVVFTDRNSHVFGMECAPADALPWKEELLAGKVRLEIAEAVGALLGRIHAASAGPWNERCRHELADMLPFQQLRIDPYLRTVAERHPDLRAIIDREIDALLNRRDTLVHGDFSPKNILVTGSSPTSPECEVAHCGTSSTSPDCDVAHRGAHPILLDCEVAHWGNSAFDVAFCLNHLFLKGLHRPEDAAAYMRAGHSFWSAYCEAAYAEIPSSGRPPCQDDNHIDEVNRRVTQQIGCLILARIDGKSPVEYITDERTKAEAREIGKTILLDPVHRLEDVSRLVIASSEKLRRRLPPAGSSQSKNAE